MDMKKSKLRRIIDDKNQEISTINTMLVSRYKAIMLLKGKLDCANGLPALDNCFYYELGYAEQYAAEQRITNRLITEQIKVTF